MVMDIYGLGLVLQKKYRLLRVSYLAFMLGITAGVIAFIVVFFFFTQEPTAVTTTTTPKPIPVHPAPLGQ
jgi:hypothetical protein